MAFGFSQELWHLAPATLSPRSSRDERLAVARALTLLLSPGREASEVLCEKCPITVSLLALHSDGGAPFRSSEFYSFGKTWWLSKLYGNIPL